MQRGDMEDTLAFSGRQPSLQGMNVKHLFISPSTTFSATMANPLAKPQ